MDALTLPELPEPAVQMELWCQIIEAYGPEQMREYAKQAVEAEREACGRIADRLGAQATAVAIRARSKL